VSTANLAGDLLSRLKAFEGRHSGPPFAGPDEVNKAMIRHWCDAIGDDLAVYWDDAAAAASVHAGVIAPPTMIQAWVMAGYRRPQSDSANGQAVLLALLEEHGFSSTVATDCEQEYLREVRPGDRLTLTSVIETVSEEKHTALGAGHFVTSLMKYHDQHGELVATQRWRILRFKPAASGAPPPPRPLRPRPSLTSDNAWWFEALQRHELRIQRCSTCGTLRHPPRPVCDRCGSLDWNSIPASGHGSVYSFVVNHYPKVAAFDYPLPIGLIELTEGTRLVANLVGVEPAAVRIGMPVVVEFADLDPELTLPAFRPLEA
jgi:uncharacterized OB-fold protein/acyl-coenzyme A thioesterase PaaI-like protein